MREIRMSGSVGRGLRPPYPIRTEAEQGVGYRYEAATVGRTGAVAYAGLRAASVTRPVLIDCRRATLKHYHHERLPMNDEELLARINELVQEEHTLQEQEEAGELTDPDHSRMRALKIALDQCWDLLRQRRARRANDQDPDGARPRPEEVVEGYIQERLSQTEGRSTFTTINTAQDLVGGLAVGRDGSIFVIRASYDEPGGGTGLEELSPSGESMGKFAYCKP